MYTEFFFIGIGGPISECCLLSIEYDDYEIM